jgi:hypothetical protein
VSLLFRIETSLRRSGLSASRFGRVVANDPRLVHDLRRGRQPGAMLQARILLHIATAAGTATAAAAAAAATTAGAITLQPGDR